MHNEDLGVFLYIIKNMQVTGVIGHQLLNDLILTLIKIISMTAEH